VTDPQTGEVKQVDIFVAALGASGYTYAEACVNQSKQSVINAHIRAFEFYQGVTQIIVPDNLKSAVTKADKYDPELNQSFQDMAEHYGTVVIPARPYRPKDKPKVELSVKLVQRWILARLCQSLLQRALSVNRPGSRSALYVNCGGNLLSAQTGSNS